MWDRLLSKWLQAQPAQVFEILPLAVQQEAPSSYFQSQVPQRRRRRGVHYCSCCRRLLCARCQAQVCCRMRRPLASESGKQQHSHRRRCGPSASSSPSSRSVSLAPFDTLRSPSHRCTWSPSRFHERRCEKCPSCCRCCRERRRPFRCCRRLCFCCCCARTGL